MNAVEPADPLRGFFELFFSARPVISAFGWHAPGVMGFVVDDEDVLRRGHLLQALRGRRLRRSWRRACRRCLRLGDLLLGLPVQRVPVADHDLALAQLVLQAQRDDVELLVVVAAATGDEHLQAVLDRQARGDDEDVLREARVLRDR